MKTADRVDVRRGMDIYHPSFEGYGVVVDILPLKLVLGTGKVVYAHESFSAATEEYLAKRKKLLLSRLKYLKGRAKEVREETKEVAQSLERLAKQ